MSRDFNSFLLLDLAKRETTFGTAIAGFSGSWRKFTEVPNPNVSITEDTDEEEAKGVVGITSHKQTAKRSAYTLTQKLDVDVFGYMLSCMMANVSTSGTTNYTHTVKEPGATIVSPWSFPLVQASDRNVTGTFWERRGAAVNQISLVREAKGPWTATYEIQDDGSETDASAVAAPARDGAAEGIRLYSFENTLLFGTVGNEDQTANIRRIEIVFTADLQEVDVDSRGIYVGRFDHGPNAPNVAVNLQLAGAKYGTLYNYWLNQTALIFDLTIARDSNRSIRLQLNSARCNAENDTPHEWRNRVEEVVNLPLRGEWNSSDSSKFVATVKNQIAAYSAAA